MSATTVRLLRALFVAYVALTFLHIAYVVAHEPFAFDAWNVAQDTHAKPVTLQRFFEFWYREYTHSNPRLGQPFSYLSYKLVGFAEVGTPLAFLACVGGAFTLGVGRRPSWRDGRDLATLAIGMGLLWIASPNLPAYMFCRAYATNYVWTAALQLWFLVALFHHDPADRRSLRLAAIALFGIAAGMCNEHTGPTLVLFTAIAAVQHWRRHRQIPPYLAAGVLGALIGFGLIFFAPGQAERYEDFLNVRYTLTEQILVRGFAGNLEIVNGLLTAAGPLLLLLFAIMSAGFVFERRPEAGLAEVRVEQRRVIGLVGVMLLAAIMVTVTIFASPKLGPRFYMHPMILLLGGVLGAARVFLHRARAYAAFVVIAAAISVYSAAKTIPEFTRLARDSDARLAELAATPVGGMYTGNAWEQITESWYFLGDDLRDQKKRELVAKYFGLRRVLFRGSELWGPLGVSDAKLTMHYDFDRPQCIDELDSVDLKQYIGRDVGALHRTLLESIDEIRHATEAKLRTLDVTITFLGAQPPMPRPTLFLGRWKDEKFEGYTAGMRRLGRTTTRELRMSPELQRLPWDIYIVAIGDPPKLLGKSNGGKPLTYSPWRTGPYWGLACNADACFVVFATHHGA